MALRWPERALGPAAAIPRVAIALPGADLPSPAQGQIGQPQLMCASRLTSGGRRWRAIAISQGRNGRRGW